MRKVLASEYEGRLFDGGVYSHNRLRRAAKDAPIHQMIEVARRNYNTIRAAVGLPEITDWTRSPEQRVPLEKT